MTAKISVLACALSLLCSCSRAGNGDSSPPAANPMPAPPTLATTLSSATPAPAPSAASSDNTSTLLAVGSDVPDVSAVAQDGKKVSLRELKGKPLVVYFYPKDDTPGCTIEAKGIRDQYKELKSRAVVLGVSSDTQDSHKAFASKYGLPFMLLDDSSHTLATAFGVPVTSGHAKRVTFVIDAAGKVQKVFPNVNPDGHAAELIEALKSLG